MTLPTDERLRAIMLKIKSLGGKEAFASQAGVGVRTVYRQLEADPPRMSDTTRAGVVRVLEEMGLLEDYDARELQRAVRDLAERAATSGESPADDGPSVGKVVREVDQAPPGGPRPQTKASSHQDDQPK